MFIRLTSRKSSIYHHYWSCHIQTIKLESSSSRFANESHDLRRTYCDKQKLINDSFEKEFIVQSSMECREECKYKIPIYWSVTKNRAFIRNFIRNNFSSDENNEIIIAWIVACCQIVWHCEFIEFVFDFWPLISGSLGSMVRCEILFGKSLMTDASIYNWLNNYQLLSNNNAQLTMHGHAFWSINYRTWPLKCNCLRPN